MVLSLLGNRVKGRTCPKGLLQHWKLYLVGLHPPSSQNTWNFLSVEIDKGIFCCVSGWVLDLTQGWQIAPRRTNHVIRDLYLSVLPLTSWEERGDGDWVQSPMANDLVNYDYVMDPPYKPSRTASWLFGGASMLGKNSPVPPCWAPNSQGQSFFVGISPYISLFIWLLIHIL